VHPGVLDVLPGPTGLPHDVVHQRARSRWGYLLASMHAELERERMPSWFGVRAEDSQRLDLEYPKRVRAPVRLPQGLAAERIEVIGPRG